MKVLKHSAVKLCMGWRNDFSFYRTKQLFVLKDVLKGVTQGSKHQVISEVNMNMGEHDQMRKRKEPFVRQATI